MGGEEIIVATEKASNFAHAAANVAADTDKPPGGSISR